MADLGISGPPRSSRRPRSLLQLLANPDIQRRLASLPLVRRFVRREGEAMFDVIAGFCQSQVLSALVRLGIPNALLDRPQSVEALAQRSGMSPDRMQVLLRAGAAIGMVKQRRGTYTLTTRGAALAGVPGLQDMIAHHDVLYRDLSDPVAFFRGEVETELAGFWPYVFGAGAAEDPEAARRYSDLMADSQAIVAQDTLATVSLSGVSCLMDVGGGSGAFLEEVGQRNPMLDLILFDLPAVAPAANARMAAAGLTDRVRIVPGSFRDDPLPKGAEAISLVRVLYDHDDQTVRRLLAAVRDALPPGGRIIVSEPMTGGAEPSVAGDVYFALYCMAMRTGRARSQEEIAALLSEAGFTRVQSHKPRRAYVTSVVEAVNPA